MKLPSCEISPNAPFTPTEKVFGGLGLLSFILGLLVVGIVCGCANSPSGVKVVASSASYTNIGDINWDEYKIPILSLYLGPKATLWVNKNYKALDEIEVNGSVTNTTTALAIYDSKENKTLNLRVKFRDTLAPTNAAPACCSGLVVPVHASTDSVHTSTNSVHASSN